MMVLPPYLENGRTPFQTLLTPYAYPNLLVTADVHRMRDGKRRLYR